MPSLIGNSHEIAGKVFELSEPVVTVGRTPNNRIHLPDNSVSSRHAELRLEGLDYIVKDLDSTNGTRVNGEKVTTYTLRRNDVLRFGNMEVVYESEHEPVLIPLPKLTLGINLANCQCQGRPSHFNVSGNAGKPKRSKLSPWFFANLFGLILAVSSVGFFLYSMLTTS